MNRTRSDSRYLELESSTHCNGHEAESARGSPYALKLIHHAQQKVPLSFCLPVSSFPRLFFPMLPFSLFRSLLLLLVSSSRVSRPVRTKSNRLHSRIVEYLSMLSEISNCCIKHGKNDFVQVSKNFVKYRSENNFVRPLK